MTQLKNKSEQNIEAAKVLGQNKYLGPSVHCSYYSCFQLMKHILISKYNFSEEEIKSASRESKGNVHHYITNQVALKYSDDLQKNQELLRRINYCRWFRNEVDYENKPVDDAKAAEVNVEAEKILRQLKAEFNI